MDYTSASGIHTLSFSKTLTAGEYYQILHSAQKQGMHIRSDDDFFAVTSSHTLLGYQKQGVVVYVFTVKKDGNPYTEVTIVGNNNVTIYELPVGTYTIEENTKWSWRYTANNGSSAALTSQNPTGTIICTNTRTIDKWLNGFSDVVTNTFGVKHD